MKQFYSHFFTTLIVSLSFNAFSQSEHRLQLSTGSVEMQELDDHQLSADDIADWALVDAKRYGYVKFGSYPNQDQKEALRTSGVELLEYIPKRTFLISIVADTDPGLLNAFEPIAAVGVSANTRTNLDFQVAPFRAIQGQNRIVNLHPHSNLGLEVLKERIKDNVVEILSEDLTSNYLEVLCSSTQFETLKNEPAVAFIDWKYDAGMPENYTGRTSHRVRYLSPQNSNGIGYTGEGINVMLQDDGAIGPHIDHEGRILAQYWSGDLGDHGDHVGGTIAGAGNLSPYHEGQARGSNLYVYKAAPEYQGFDSIALHYNTKNIVITSTSYSNGCNAGYTALARTMDQQIYDHESLVHVFSAGNSGGSNCGYGAGAGWGNVTGGHKIGKNTITVANLTETDLLAGSSSRGPAHDGRIKPDISAKGVSVVSTTNDNDYVTKTGTSMSCPGVSGTLAVLYEAFDDVHGSLPESGLMKAIVLNTADDLGNVGPDFKFGWGRINARKAFQVIAAETFTDGSITNGDSTQFTIIVPPGMSSAKMMLYWTDPEASINASTALVNDLDLTIMDPNGTWHQPYVLDHSASASALDSPAQPGEDHLNNMEQVAFNAPAAGNYLVKVKGYDVPDGPQEFFVVYYFEPDQSVLTYPVGGESFVPFNSELLRWDTPLTSGTATIQYSTNGGSSWFTIATSVSASQGYYQWTVPNSTTGQARVRLIIGGDTLSSSDFSIIETPTGLEIEYSCPDSIGLTWDAVSGATGYEVYHLGDKYMEPIGQSLTNEFVDTVSNPLSDKLWYSIVSLGPDNAISKRMYAVQKQPGIENCPIQYDGGVSSISPESGSYFLCHGDSLTISFEVINDGQNPISSIDADFNTSEGQSISESFTVNISPGSSQLLVFSNKVLIAGPQVEGELIIDVPNDGNSYNDSIHSTYFVEDGATITPIWAEDFESFDQCGTDADCGSTICSLENGWVNELNGLTDDIDWRTNSGETFSQFTGPDADHTTGSSSGKYLYLEASGGCVGATASMTSPCIDLTNAEEPVLTFWYHMYGFDMGSLSVDVFDGEIWYSDVFSIAGNQGTSWELAEVSLSAFNGKIINLRFRGITGVDYRSDMAIDDINIIHPPIAAFDYGVQLDGLTIDFTDNSQYGDDMSFDLGEGTVLDSVPGSFTYPQITVYTVQQIVTNEVGSDTALQLITTLGADQDVERNGLAIFPNPATDALVLERSAGIGMVQLYSADGRLVGDYNFENRSRSMLNISSLDAGIYYLKFDGNRSMELSIVK